MSRFKDNFKIYFKIYIRVIKSKSKKNDIKLIKNRTTLK